MAKENVRRNWTFLVACCMQLVALAINVSWGKHMNVVETLSIILHLVGLLLLTALLIFARATGTVSTNFSFSSATGWSPSFGVALDVVYATTVISGFDCASHLAEDTADPGRQVPRSLLWTTTLNKIACILCAVRVGLTCRRQRRSSIWWSARPFRASVWCHRTTSLRRFQRAKGLSKRAFRLLCCNSLDLLDQCYCRCQPHGILSYPRRPESGRAQTHGGRSRKATSTAYHHCAHRVVATGNALDNFYSGVGFQAIGSQCVLSLSSTYLMAVGCSLNSRFWQPDLLGRNWGGIFHLGTRWYAISKYSPSQAHPLIYEQWQGCRHCGVMLPCLRLGFQLVSTRPFG